MTKKKDVRCNHHRTPVKAVFSATGWYCPVCKKRVIEADVDVAEQCEMAVGALDFGDAYCIAKDYLSVFDLEKQFGGVTTDSLNKAMREIKKTYSEITWSRQAVVMMKRELVREA